MTASSTRRAHAKLTVSLHITGVRADGYHVIDAEMVSLELHDQLTFVESAVEAISLEATGPFAAGMPLDRSNLVARALDVAGRGAQVTIDKRIPHGGGLGGGSTDAATALRWAGFGTSNDELARAAALGADIPFCLVGGRAHVGGIGELVDPLPPTHGQPIILIIPPLQVSTPAVYRAWDQLEPAHRAGPRNDLETAAIVVEPELAQWRDRIIEHLGRRPTLAGSGATWFIDDMVDGAADDGTGGVLGSSLALLERLGATIVQTRTVDAVRATGPGA